MSPAVFYLGSHFHRHSAEIPSADIVVIYMCVLPSFSIRIVVFMSSKVKLKYICFVNDFLRWLTQNVLYPKTHFTNYNLYQFRSFGCVTLTLFFLSSPMVFGMCFINSRKEQNFFFYANEMVFLLMLRLQDLDRYIILLKSKV